MNWRHGLSEAALFLVASAVGIYGLGEGLNGFFGTGPTDVLWLAVSAVALIVLAKQMGRVQDRWPRRSVEGTTTSVTSAPTPLTQSAEASRSPEQPR